MDLTPQRQLADLRSASENVADYLDREIFRDTFEDENVIDYTIEDILQECYAIVLQELVELGIKFTCDESDLLQDWYTAHTLYSLRYFFDANNFREFLVANTEDITLLQNILDSDESEDVFQQCVDVLYQQHPDDLYLKDIDYLSRDIYSSYRFKDHIKAIIEVIISNGENIIIPDVARAKRYIEKTQILRKLANETSERIMSKLDDITWNKALVDKILRDYDLDKISPETIKIYSAIDLDEVSPYLEKTKEKKLDEHHKRSLHHIEYWLDEDKDPRPTPEKEHLLVMVAHHNEPDTDAATFWQEIREMLDKGKEIFSEEQIALITRMADAVYPRGED